MVKSLTGKSRHGHIVRDMKTEHRLSESELDELGIIYPGMSDRGVLNAYRELRGKLFRLSDNKNFVCLTSSLAPKGDSSACAINLGAVFAFDRARSAIVIDCDARENLFDKLLPDTENRGLIDFIENEDEDLSSLIRESGVPRLRIIPSGALSETSAEMFESRRMKEIISEIKNRYPDRFVFVNAPNMNLASEVQSLAAISDMTLFDVPYASVLEEDVRDAIETIGEDKVAGIIFSQ